MKRFKVPSSIWYRQHKVLSLVIAVVLIGIVFWGYQAYSGYTNKKSFEKALAAIDIVYADIVSEVGPPDNYKHTNDCSRPSGVYEDGPLSCSVSTSFIYGVANRTEANNLLKKIQTVIGEHQDLLKPTQALAATIEDTLVVNTYHHSALDSYTRGGSMDCYTSYFYDTFEEIDLTISSKVKKPFQINLGCSDFANKEYYPIH
ncbi:MAG: hypothetical protein WD887_01155 [Candidatus Saccharimonadales bacterium]